MLNAIFSHPFDVQLFLSTFGLIFVAELPDKTAFAILLLATRRHPFAIFIGVAAAFVIQSFIAVSFGSLFALLPEYVVKIAAAMMFFAFAVAMWLRKQEDDEDGLAKGSSATFWATVSTSFMVIFVAEWGDLTQLATATLQAKYNNPVTIFTSATLSLWSTTAIAILVGNRLQKLINAKFLQKIAAVAFAVVGVILLVGIKR